MPRVPLQKKAKVDLAGARSEVKQAEQTLLQSMLDLQQEKMNELRVRRRPAHRASDCSDHARRPSPPVFFSFPHPARKCLPT